MSDSNLKILRDRIDEIDQKLQDLLNERAEISIQVKVIRIMLHFLRIFLALQQNFIRKIEKLF